MSGKHAASTAPHEDKRRKATRFYKECKFDHTFERTVAAYLMRYPKHPLVPIMAGCTTLEEGIVPGTDIIRVVRRVQVHLEAPFWVRKLLGFSVADILQIQLYNPKARWLETVNSNETIKTSLNLVERAVFEPDPENPEHTVMKLYGGLHMMSLLGIERIVENLGIKSYDKNVELGRKMILKCVDSMADQALKDPYSNLKQLTASEFAWNPMDIVYPDVLPLFTHIHEGCRDLDAELPQSFRSQHLRNVKRSPASISRRGSKSPGKSTPTRRRTVSHDASADKDKVKEKEKEKAEPTGGPSTVSSLSPQSIESVDGPSRVDRSLSPVRVTA